MNTKLSDMSELEAFYERHWKYVYRLCLTYMKSEADAEDCTEDVFVKVLTGDFSFNDEIHERKWLTLTAINLCKDRLKSWKRKLVVPMYKITITVIMLRTIFMKKNTLSGATSMRLS